MTSCRRSRGGSSGAASGSMRWAAVASPSKSGSSKSWAKTRSRDERVNGILTIAQLTWLEARRRRIVLAAVLCGVTFLLIFAMALYFMPPRILTGAGAVLARFQLQGMTLAGLYVVNFLLVVFAV